MLDSPSARLRFALLELTNLIVLLAQYERAHPTRKAKLTAELGAKREALIRLLQEAW